MADDRIIRAIVEKCDFLYDDALLTKETIIEKYLTFFARQFNPSERSVNFVFHTGSLCFDVVSVAALMIGCLAYEFSSNDEILAGLENDDMVLFKGERYRWGGIEERVINKGEPARKFFILRQDAKGKNGGLTSSYSYDSKKHLVKPYYGTSSITDGRGVRKDNSNRNDFISYVLDIPVPEVPSTLDYSVVVVADKSEFIEICKHLKIRYNSEKTVEITDVVPVSYYTASGEQSQIGRNITKAEPVIKVTGKMSMARDLVLDKTGNRVIGLMVTNSESPVRNATELNDLLRRKSLKFAYVISPFSPESCEFAMDQYESAKMFACTKELLSTVTHEVKEPNKLTEELNRQIVNILKKETHSIHVEGYWNWEEYKSVKEKLYVVKQSNWSGEDKDDFILSSMALLNLFGTSFFSMQRMENAISAHIINVAVISPGIRLNELKEIASNASSMREKCLEIVSALEDMYKVLYDSSPKEEALTTFLKEHQDEKIAVIVPKAYYTELFSDIFLPQFKNAVCITANRFDGHEQYDAVIAVGDIIGKRFDSLQCFAAPAVYVLLYDFEQKTFTLRKKKSAKSERKLNARIKGLKGDDYVKAVGAESDDTDVPSETIREFSDLDEYVESMGIFDIRKLQMYGGGNSGDYSNTAEVKYVGIFTTGEQILFSKFYSPVVFDQAKGEIVETAPEKLQPGDVLVFTKRNDYTSNIVDQIFDQLVSTRKLSPEVQDAAEKAFYWKEALREFKEKNRLTYRAVAKLMKAYGSSLQEVTIRQWLIEESHIIGPRDVTTMQTIAYVTQDPFLLTSPKGYFEACCVVRSYRRKILALIADAINDKLSNKQLQTGSEFEVVYENVEKLSETMELDRIIELESVEMINNGMVNRPISEAEVLM